MLVQYGKNTMFLAVLSNTYTNAIEVYEENAEINVIINVIKSNSHLI